MEKRVSQLLSRIGIKNKKEQTIVLIILGVVIIYLVGYQVGVFVSHLQN